MQITRPLPSGGDIKIRIQLPYHLLQQQNEIYFFLLLFFSAAPFENLEPASLFDLDQVTTFQTGECRIITTLVGGDYGRASFKHC